MALRVIWQYMDRSVTKNILYGPKLLNKEKPMADPYISCIMSSKGPLIWMNKIFVFDPL